MNFLKNNTSTNCVCPTCIPNAINHFSAIVTPFDNSGLTGGNINVNVAGSGGGAGATGTQGQSVVITTVINCGELKGGCCDMSKNGVFSQIIS